MPRRTPEPQPIGALLARARLVRHVAVYRTDGTPSHPLCNSPGRFPHHEWAYASPHLPWCGNCATMVEHIAAHTTGQDRLHRQARADADALAAIADLLRTGPVGAESQERYIRADRIRACMPRWLCEQMNWTGDDTGPPWERVPARPPAADNGETIVSSGPRRRSAS